MGNAMPETEPRLRASLHLLGPFVLRDGAGRAVTPRRKTRAVLAYLAGAERAPGRLELARLFCQESADPARTLRLLLSRVRRALGPDALLEEDEAIRLNPRRVTLDTTAFQAALEGPRRGGRTAEALEAALALYRDEYLAGLHLPDAPAFELWLVGQRSRWARLFERGALALLEQRIAAGEFAAAIPVARRLLAHDPLLEEAHYHLIWLLARTGQRAAALAQFDHCRQILRQELAIAPSPPLLALRDDVAADRLARPGRALAIPSPGAPAAAAPTPVFVGREEERRQLQSAWAEARGGRTRALLVAAPAGGGKTALLRTWAADLVDSLYLYGPCYESTRHLAYQPWAAALSSLLAALPPGTPETLPPAQRALLARLLPDLPGERAGDGEMPAASAAGGMPQRLIFAAVQALLDRAPGPAILFLDDLQWADTASLQLLLFLADREAPCLLLGAYRPEEAEENPALLTLLNDGARHPAFSRLELAPLSPAAVEVLIARLWPELPAAYRAPHLRDRLHQATGGNPLFVNEIVRELAAAGRPAKAGQEAGGAMPEALPIPPGLRELVQRRLRGLPPSGRQVLEALAVLDRPAALEQVRRVSGRGGDEALQALELGLRWRLLRPEEAGRVAFGHDLMAQAVREQLSAVRRGLLHRRAAVALTAARAPAATLAYHWGRAGDERQERSHAIQAGHDAAALYAHEEAAAYWTRALELSDDPREGAMLRLHLGRAYLRLGDWTRADAVYRQALAPGGPLEAAADRRLRAELGADYGLLLEYRGEYDAALAQDEAALAIFLELDDRPQVGKVLGLIALLHWRQSRYDEALATCRRALADPAALTDPTAHTRLHNIAGLIHWRRGAYDAALDHLGRAHDLALRHGDRFYEGLVLGNLGNVVQEMGQYDRAIAYYRQALAIHRELRNQMGVAMFLGNIALMQFYKGDDEAALEMGHQALAMERELGNRESVARLLSNLANSFSRLERHDAAFDYCREALEIDAGLGNRRGALIHAGNLGTIYLLWGHVDQALACLAYALAQDEPGELARERGRHLADVAAAYLAAGQLERAEAAGARALAIQEPLGLPFELCWAHLVRGRLLLARERFAEAVSALEEAATQAGAAHRADVRFAARVRLPRARVLAGAADPAAARAALEDLLEGRPAPREAAHARYELWRLSGGDGDRERARAALAPLLAGGALAGGAQADDRRRAAALGLAPGPPPPAPPLPEPIAGNPPDAAAYLAALLDKPPRR